MSLERVADSNLRQLMTEVDKDTTEILGRGSDLGADRVKCAGSCGKKSRLVVENGEFTLADTITSKSLGVLVHKDQKKGSSSTNATAQEDLNQAVSNAMDLASFSVADPFLTMANQEQAPPAQDLPFLFDPKLVDVSLEELGDLMKDVLALFKEQPKFALDRFELGTGVGYGRMRNSLGVNQRELQTSMSWSYMGMAIDGDQVSGMDYESESVYSFADAHGRISANVRDFLKRVMDSLNPLKCPSYKGPILIAPRAISDLFLRTILYQASGSSVMDGKSKWDKSIGTQVMSDKFTLRDRPHEASQSGATSYDADGLPTRDQMIIDRGVLKTHLLSCYSAGKLGRTSNAMAGGPFCLEIEAGNDSVDDLYRARDKLLLISRFSGNVDVLTGDFSGLAKASRLIEGGKDVGAVGETMIAGNVFELAANILGVANQSQLVSGSYRAPMILADCVTVS